jgi:hypothetical protein
LVTKKSYIDFDESEGFESGTDSVVDELELSHPQPTTVEISPPSNFDSSTNSSDFASKQDSSNHFEQQTDQSRIQKVSEAVATPAIKPTVKQPTNIESTVTQEVSKNQPEINTVPTIKPSRKNVQTEIESVHQDHQNNEPNKEADSTSQINLKSPESDSSSQDRQINAKSDEVTKLPEACQDNAHQNKPMDETDSVPQSVQVPAIIEKTPTNVKQKPAKKKASKTKQPEIKSPVHVKKNAPNQSKQTTKECVGQTAKKPKENSSEKSHKKHKDLLIQEQKRLAKQKAKQEKKKAKVLKKASAQAKKKQQATPVQTPNNNKLPQVKVAAPKAMPTTPTKKDKAKSQSQTESVKTKKVKNCAASKAKLEKPVIAEKEPSTKRKPVLTLDPKSTDSILKKAKTEEGLSIKKESALTLDPKSTDSTLKKVKIEEGLSTKKESTLTLDPKSTDSTLKKVKTESVPIDLPLQERSPRYPRRAIGPETLEKLRMMAKADACAAKCISRERGRIRKRAQSMPPDIRPAKKHMASA